MTAPKEIIDLVNKFKNHEDEYKKNFTEEDTKNHFINPFFEALGWKIQDTEDKPLDLEEVRYEKHQRSNENFIEFPDYTFLSEGIEQFFVEAKRPSENIETDKTIINQVRVYGYNAGLTLSIVTDFEGFAVYDTRFNPYLNDKTRPYLIKQYHYTEYIDKWDEISKFFSKNAVDNNNHCKILPNYKNVSKGISTIDQDFLDDIRNWRYILAQNIASNNRNLINNDEKLNYSVQQIIDRIIFFRIAEDRYIEKNNTLKNLSESKSIYKKFLNHCKYANTKYNSGLFCFDSKQEDSEQDNDQIVDKITDKLHIDDNILKQIFENLYQPNCPYDFRVLPLEILGKIYEEFLCEELHLNGEDIEIQMNKRVNKENGIYYTPKRVTQYIVKNTVGEVIKKKNTIDEISEIKILDPASGSGTFLLAAYDYLLKYYLNYYKGLEHPPKDVMFINNDGKELLTISKKREILINNIYGVDIDQRATEVTKLSLLLKVLEDFRKDENEEQPDFNEESILPNLDNNILCGNSIVKTNVYEDYQEVRGKMDNPFDYCDEFSEIFSDYGDVLEISSNNEKGFDVIIGNPPYIRAEKLEDDFKDYLYKNFNLYVKKADIYICFFERSLNLLKKDGYLGFICSNKYTTTDYGEKLRKRLSNENYIKKYLECGKVFDKASVETSVIVVQNSSRKNNKIYLNIEGNKFFLDQKWLNEKPWLLKEEKFHKLRNKIFSKGVQIGNIQELSIDYGIKTGKNEVFVINEHKKMLLDKEDEKIRLQKENEILKFEEEGVINTFEKDFYMNKLKEYYSKRENIIKPVLGGEDILDWNIYDKGKFLIFTRRGIKIECYPAIVKYLTPFYKDLRPKNDDEETGRKSGNYEWYEMQDPIYYYTKFNKPKLIYSEMSKENRIFFDKKNKYYLINSAYMITHKEDDEFYLRVLGAILSSNVLNFYIKLISTKISEEGIRHLKKTMNSCPIVPFNTKDSKINELCEHAINIQSESIEMHRITKEHDLDEDDVPSKEIKFKRQKNYHKKKVKELKDKINCILYNLYDITPEEIKIIEDELDNFNP